jgi:hypothetical protein
VEEKETEVKMNRREIKEVIKSVYLGSVVEKNGKIQNEISERIGKASEFYNLTKSLLWYQDVNRICKIAF